VLSEKEIEQTKGLITSDELCQKLNINKATLTKIRKVGLQPQFEIPNGLHKPDAYWNLEHVEAWISDNKINVNRLPKNTDKFSEMYSRLCDSEKISYNSYAALINTNASESQIAQARKEWTDVIKTLREVERDIEKQYKRRQAKSSEINKNQSLKFKRLKQQLEDGRQRLEMLARQNELSKIEFESKRGEWYTKKQVEELALLFITGLDNVVRAIELQVGSEAARIISDMFNKTKAEISEKIKV
jgi:hypothetical protein